MVRSVDKERRKSELDDSLDRVLTDGLHEDPAESCRVADLVLADDHCVFRERDI
jgi:hypothetical protein